MSPKAGSGTKVVPRTGGFSRDVRPNASGVTYSRRSYYYDREFSDSIIRPTDDFESSPSGSPTVRRHQEPVSRFNGEYIRTPSHAYVLESRQPLQEEFFRKGRTLQSASTSDDNNDTTRVQASTPAAPTDSEPRLTIWGFDLQTIAQGAAVAAGLSLRVYEEYLRIRDSEENGGDGEDEDADGESHGLDLDPYHLEAGPPRRLRSSARVPLRRILPAPKNTTEHALAVTASTSRTTSTMNGTEGNATGQSGNAPTARSMLPPLPASKRVCYYMIATVALGVLASFGFALWWAQSQGDVSAAFTIGGYVIAVDALVVAVVGVVHRPGCRCWKA